MPERRSSPVPPSPAGTLAGIEKRASLEDRMSPSEMMSGSQVWEEGGRLAANASQMTPPHGPATRQVVDLSLPENTPVAELPVATGLLSTLPNPGKQKLAGSESARTGTAAQSTEQESASSDRVFANVCCVSAVGDSQVKEPLSLRQAHSTGKMSVENQGRRQAGTNTRAGSATPPNLSFVQAGKMKRLPLIPSAGKSAPLPTLGQVLAADLSPDVLAPETPFFSRGVHAQKKEVKKGMEPQVSPGTEGCSEGAPGEIEQRKKTSDKGDTLPPAEVFLSEVPPPMQKGINFGFKAPQTTSPTAKEASQPKVQIGLLEVVVVSPGQDAHGGQSKESVSSNLASRFYLRNV